MSPVDSLNIPWLPNLWRRGICLDRDTAPVKAEGPEESKPDAVF